jgi:hypothetical protein
MNDAMNLEDTLATAQKHEQAGDFARAAERYRIARTRCTVDSERAFCDEAIERCIQAEKNVHPLDPGPADPRDETDLKELGRFRNEPARAAMVLN